MPADIRDRIRSIRKAIQSKSDEDKARTFAKRYEDLSEGLSGVRHELDGLRAQTQQFVDEGYRDPTPDLAPLSKGLESERENLDTILEVNTAQFFAVWRAISTEWSSNCQGLVAEIEDRYSGAGLTEEVLKTLRPHFPEVIDELKDRQRKRSHLRAQKPKPANYLEQLKALHEEDLRSLESFAGKGTGDEWKEALQGLVSAAGISWPDLQGSPLMKWLERHDLLGHCRVRLR